ncbi:thioredoxin-like protein [Phellopilus nigrolimitatus]|nr:thioredoxin-like protein [Phellopilus nigrolimitatus]
MADTISTSGANAPGGKIIVHHLNNSRSQRILWLLEELEVPYEIKQYKRTPDYTAPDDLKIIHPIGKAPIITDGDTVIAESGAIVEYIIAKYAKEEQKPTKEEWLDNIYFSHYSEGSLMPLLVNKLMFTLIPQRTPFFIRPIAKLIFGKVLKTLIDPRLAEHKAFIEAHLGRSKTGWFANSEHPTSADYMMFFPLEALNARLPEHGPKIGKFVKRVHERPAYKRAAEKGGEFVIA